MIHEIKRIIEFIGDNPDRPGLKETPNRVLNAYKEIFSGYNADIPSIFKLFPDEISKSDGLVIERNISFFSTCEHHMLPFNGVAYFGYVPKNGVLIGASKIARLVDAYSRRLQIQERLGQEIINSFMEYMKPEGCMLVLIAKHNCMMCRGVKQANSDYVTSHIAGSFEDTALRLEFLNLISLSNN
jgi:GTP cyclohydrolase IA